MNANVLLLYAAPLNKAKLVRIITEQIEAAKAESPPAQLAARCTEPDAQLVPLRCASDSTQVAE